jgi:hypothetical protein
LLLLERGSSVHAVAAEQSVTAGPEPLSIRFDIAAIEEAGDLVFRGWPDGDGAATARIFDVTMTIMSDGASVSAAAALRGRDSADSLGQRLWGASSRQVR